VTHHIQDCTRRHSSGDRCEGELERALALFLRMDNRPTTTDDLAERSPETLAVL
jgi:hypothetical protein